MNQQQQLIVKIGNGLAGEKENFPMDRLLIVDGHNLLFQMFFGMPARIVNEQGKAIQGTLGFTGALLKIIRLTEPTHITVLFDGQHGNCRSVLDSGYKANRIDYGEANREANREAAEEDNPFSQLPDIYAALDYLDIRHAETAVCETDDWIAGYAFSYGRETEIIISSFDSDFFQLITDQVSVLRYRGDHTRICTPEYIKEKFGITPSQYADFKSLTGDAADNIKGAEKVGPKTAASLLNEFGSLENILIHAAEIKKPSIKASIIRNSERLRTNYQLIRLNNLAELPFSLNELSYRFSGITTSQVLRGIGLR